MRFQGLGLGLLLNALFRALLSTNCRSRVILSPACVFVPGSVGAMNWNRVWGSVYYSIAW